MSLFLLFSKISLYLAVLSLRSGLRDLSLQNADSRTATCGLKLSCSTARGILVPGQWIGSTSSALQGRLLTPGPPETLPPRGALSVSLNAGYTAWVPLMRTLFTELPEGGDWLLLAFHPETLEELDAC